MRGVEPILEKVGSVYRRAREKTIIHQPSPAGEPRENLGDSGRLRAWDQGHNLVCRSTAPPGDHFYIIKDKFSAVVLQAFLLNGVKPQYSSNRVSKLHFWPI